MAKARVYRAGLVNVVTSKVRVYRAGLTGTAPIAPKVRVYRAGLTGTAGVLVAPLTGQTVEPETTVTIAAALVGGGAADSWTWRVITGTATIVGTGATVTLRAPSGMTGASVVAGVRATISGTTSIEQTVTIDSLPQVRWAFSGGTWAGQRPAVSL